MLSRRSLLALLAATALLRLAHSSPSATRRSSASWRSTARSTTAGRGRSPPATGWGARRSSRRRSTRTSSRWSIASLAAAPLAVYLLQIAVAVLGCWALVRAGEALAGPRAAGATGLLFALYTPFWFYDVQLMKESFAVSAVCLLLFLLLKARASDRLALWFLVGLVAAFLALLRENMLLVVPFLLLLTWREKTGKGWMLALRRCGLLLLGLSLPLLAVASRNAALGGGFLPTTSQGGVNFWIGNNPAADGTYRPLVPGKQVPAYEREGARILAEQAVGRPLAADEVSGYWLRRSLSWARAEPVAFVRLQFAKLGLYWDGYEWPDAVDYYWMKTISRPLAPAGARVERGGAARALGLLLERRRLAVWAPVLLFELGWMLSVVAFFVFSRYRLPAVPGLLLLAAIPVARAAEAFGRGDKRQKRGDVRRASRSSGWRRTCRVRPAARSRRVQPRPPGRGARRPRRPPPRTTSARSPPIRQNLSATLNLGNLAARAGDYATARVPLRARRRPRPRLRRRPRQPRRRAARARRSRRRRARARARARAQLREPLRAAQSGDSRQRRLHPMAR